MPPYFIEENEPCLVPARQGFSVLYKNRSLYSRYNAEATIKTLVEGLAVAPETLFLCFSPAAGYGLTELLAKLPEKCHIITVEKDPYLFAFYSRTCPKEARCHKRVSNLFLHDAREIAGMLVSGFFVPPLHQFRRIVVLEMSGGYALNADVYRETEFYARDALARYWKNHATLTKLGKLYNTNFFKNAAALSGSVPFPRHSVTKPVIVVGAGPSASETVSLLAAHPELRGAVYVLAVDAALLTLTGYGIAPDGVVAVESQLAIEKAYVGSRAAAQTAPVCGRTTQPAAPHLFLDMTSRPHITGLFARYSFFATEYRPASPFDKNTFLSRFLAYAAHEGVPVFKPLGSVGNYAVELALELRAPNTPVLLTGLDFSFPAGLTHAKNTYQHRAALTAQNRLTGAGNYGALASTGTRAATGKDGTTCYTDAPLTGYRDLLAEQVRGQTRVFDIGRTGLPLPLPQLAAAEWEAMLAGAANTCAAGAAKASEARNSNEAPRKAETATGAAKADHICAPGATPVSPAGTSTTDTAREFLAGEKEKLELLVSHLEGRAVPPLTDEALLELLWETGYLYVHFPDSLAGPRLESGFLKRVKAEAVSFLKTINGSLARL